MSLPYQQFGLELDADRFYFLVLPFEPLLKPLVLHRRNWVPKAAKSYAGLTVIHGKDQLEVG